MRVARIPSEDESRLAAGVGLLLLGLDSVSSRFAKLGIEVVDPERVRRAAREAHESLSARLGEPPPADAVLATLTAALVDAGDPDDAARTVGWLRRLVAVRAVTTVADAWAAMLLRLTPGHVTALQQLGLGERSAARLLEIGDELGDAMGKIEDLGEELEGAATSEWDRARYREYQRESDLVSPINFLSSWLRVCACARGLAAVVGALSHNEQRLFEAWSQAAAAVETSIPESLLSLDNIDAIIAACSER
jgi:hypothetical protein